MKQIYADNYRQIGLKIAYYRKLRGLTQEELAEQTGLTPAFIGHLEAPNIQKRFLWILFSILPLSSMLPLINFLLLMNKGIIEVKLDNNCLSADLSPSFCTIVQRLSYGVKDTFRYFPMPPKFYGWNLLCFYHSING